MGQEKKFFRIEGEAVHLVTERIERTVKLSDLLGEVVKEIGITTPILPQGCRFFSQKEDRLIFVIEQAPQIRNITWYGIDDNGKKWKLAFPYVIFLVVLRGEAVSTSECRMFYRTAPLGANGPEDVLLRTNLCNVYSNGAICTGDFRVDGQTPSQKAESFVTGFWKSEFNSDLSDESFWPAAKKFPEVCSLTKWQEESVKNPLFPLGIKWFEAGKLSDAIEGRL